MSTAKTTKPNMAPVEILFSEKDIAEIRSLVNTLVLAWKNYSLYPEGHIAVIKALESVKSAFETFFQHHSFIRFIIEKDRLVCGTSADPEVFSNAASQGLVSILYRDGIQWLEFNQGLPLDELIYFFSILHRYRMLVEETEGDIVTGLNDGNLEYISFKAVDVFWEDLPLIDFSSINATPPESEDYSHDEASAHAKDFGISALGEVKTKSIADPSISRALWEITPAEQKKLQKMVQEEENWDNTEDVLEVLLVILRSQTDQYSFSSVLDFTREEVVESLSQGYFRQLLSLFQSLYQMLNMDTATELDWRRPLIEHFFLDLSKPDVFTIVADKLSMVDEGVPDEIKALREILLYFSPEIIPSLGPAIQQTKSPAIQKMILEVIEYLSLKDMRGLEILLDHPDPELAEKLLPLLERLRGEHSYRIILKMSENASAKVREEAIRVLLARDPQSILKLFPLIDDQSIRIRRHILDGITALKSPVLENMLLKYITENANHKNTAHILACYKALGGCGSNKVIPFLHNILLARAWNRYFGFGRPLHREGAATALLFLDNQRAAEILDKASRSRFKVVRKSVQMATIKKDAIEEPSND